MRYYYMMYGDEKTNFGKTINAMKTTIPNEFYIIPPYTRSDFRSELGC